MPWADKVDPNDHYLHETNGDAWWNESTFMSFRVPGRNLMVMLYHYFRPNQNTAVGGTMVWDETGIDMGTVLHYGWDWHMPIPEGAQLYDCKLPNGLALETIEPQKQTRYMYEGRDCSIDIVYTAAREPYYAKSKGGELQPGFSDFVMPVPGHLTTGHYEQYGYANGRVVVNGEEIEIVDSVVILDRSWGPRLVLSNMDRRRVAYASGMASPDHAFHVYGVNTASSDEDPVEGVDDQLVGGYYVKDGVLGDIVGGTRRCLERASNDGRPLRERIEGEDSLGRTFVAEGILSSTLRWPGLYGDFMSFVIQAEWTFDGVDAVAGEIQEWMMISTYRRFIDRTRMLTF